MLQRRKVMTDSAQPFAAKKFLEIKGRRMAYIDEGEGAPIVFAHGNPTSSYLWRNVMPACRGLGRLIACDMIGMGDSEKLPDSGPDRYTYAEQRSFLFALWKTLGVDKDVVFVLHDAGSLLGFDWTRQHPERVQGIAYMEALVQPITLADFPEDVRSLVQRCRSKDGETLVLEKNLIVENDQILLQHQGLAVLTATSLDEGSHIFREIRQGNGLNKRLHVSDTLDALGVLARPIEA